MSSNVKPEDLMAVDAFNKVFHVRRIDWDQGETELELFHADGESYANRANRLGQRIGCCFSFRSLMSEHYLNPGDGHAPSQKSDLLHRRFNRWQNACPSVADIGSA